MIAALGLSFLVSILAPVLTRFTGALAGWILALLPAGLFLFFLRLGSGLTGVEASTETLEWVPALGVSLTLRLDGFSLLFALLITGIGTLVTIYAGAYFADQPPHRRAHFLTLILLFMSAMLGTVLCDNLIVLFVFWEATSLLSFLLIGFNSSRREARDAAVQSLLVTAGGGLALLAAILLIGAELGTFSLAEITARSGELATGPVALPAMVLILLGCFTKSAQVPFHFWLPAAMEAPTPASAFLHSATMVKLGIYLLARFDPVFAALPLFGTMLVVFGSATMLVAAVRALASDGYKAVLAHSTVGSLGVLVMLIGLDGEAAATATVAFILAHALYKAALFFCAGIAIHATHEGRLSRLGGLARALPVTAAASGLAAVSMAGLPPTIGFISKEALFEGQLASTSGWAVVAVAILVNAAFVAIAGMAALRPFLSRRVDASVHHRETASLFLAPLLLAVLGLLFGLAPGLIAGSIVEPAASAILGRPVAISLSLWHGFTPMLGLSAVVVASGVALYALWDRVHRRLAANSGVERLLGEAGYESVLSGTLRLASRVTRALQNGDQRRYGAIVVAAVLAIVLFGFLSSGAGLALDPHGGRWHAPTAAILLLMVFGAVAAVRPGSLLSSVLAVGVVGFGSALIFLMNGAPDLALTQFSVEVLVAVILTALLLQLPVRQRSTRTARERGLDGALAGGFALILFVALAAMAARPLDLRLTEYFAETSYTLAHGRNVVNVILVDYRGLDTLGEISVISFAAMAVWGLLRRRATTRSGARPGPSP